MYDETPISMYESYTENHRTALEGEDRPSRSVLGGLKTMVHSYSLTASVMGYINNRMGL